MSLMNLLHVHGITDDLHVSLHVNCAQSTLSFYPSHRKVCICNMVCVVPVRCDTALARSYSRLNQSDIKLRVHHDSGCSRRATLIQVVALCRSNHSYCWKGSLWTWLEKHNGNVLAQQARVLA